MSAADEADRRYPLHAAASSLQELHNAGYQAFRAGAEWQASRKVEAAPSDTDLLAEFEKHYLVPEDDPDYDRESLLSALRAVASRTSQPVQVEVTTDMAVALRSRLTVAEAIISRAEYCVREEFQRDQVLAVLRNPLPSLAALGGGGQ